MNDLDLCLEVISRSLNHCVTFDVEYLGNRFQTTTNRKWHMSYQMVTWPMTSRDPQRCCEYGRLS